MKCTISSTVAEVSNEPKNQWTMNPTVALVNHVPICCFSEVNNEPTVQRAQLLL
jgi:hypothetical protein